MWLSTLPQRFGRILEKILDRHERSGMAVQWNGGLRFDIATSEKISLTRKKNKTRDWDQSRFNLVFIVCIVFFK